jgi:glutamine amidotransferase
MIALVDYGIGNLRSVEKALSTVGADVRLTADPDQILAANKVVLPGVGAFGDGMAGLKARGLIEVLKTVAAREIPLLGICLGMQVLFETSDELGPGEQSARRRHTGLGFLPGRVRRFKAGDDLTHSSWREMPGELAQVLKIPQTGWNQIFPQGESPLLQGLTPGSYAYFNHSYYCDPADAADVLASTDYGIRYASVVGRGRLYGVQFHPEKSQAVGLAILKNFVERC